MRWRRRMLRRQRRTRRTRRTQTHAFIAWLIKHEFPSRFEAHLREAEAHQRWVEAMQAELQTVFNRQVWRVASTFERFGYVFNLMEPIRKEPPCAGDDD